MLENAIKCAQCQHPLYSMLIDSEQRNLELIQKLTRHLENKHKEDLIRAVASTKQIAQTFVAFLFLNFLAIIPEENVELTKHFNALQDNMMSQMGFDADDTNQEEEDEDEILDRLGVIARDCTDPATREKLELLISSMMDDNEESPQLDETTVDMQVQPAVDS